VRGVVLIVALAFVGLLAALTIDVASRTGFDILTAAAILILAMFAFGIVGALRHPPDE